MKLYIKLGIILLTFSVFATSCSKFVEGEDISPNDPENASASSLLSASEVGLFATYGGGQLDRNASVMVQHATGISDQMIDVTRYNILEGDNVNEWQLIYTDILINTKTLIDKYGDQSPHYAGVAKVVQALAIGVATDFWGAVPWTDALRGLEGEDGFNPFYDTQESILSSSSNSELAIQNILDEALTLFSATENLKVPGTDDFIHGGDISAWIKTAYMVKARYAQRLTNVSEYDATVVLGYLTSAGLTGTGDDANCIFGDAGNEYNQWYAFQNDRGYMRMCETFIAPLRTNEDPRLPFFADSSGTNQDQYVGTVYGELTTATCAFGPYFASEASVIPLVSYVEMKFIEAEAKLYATDPGGAADAYNEAVTQSVEQVTGDVIPTAFKDAFASETSATITLEKIMTQKYYALVGQIEVYSDWRRLGIPTLTPYPGETAIPYRLPTVLDERLYNTNAPSPPISNIYLPLWWQGGLSN
jgi:SusD/RagB-like outer membrane lipoprotein